MDAQLKEQLRLTLLGILEATSRYGLPLDAITLQVRCRGFEKITRDQVEPELQYLEDFGFIEQALKQISPENRAWRIHAKGRDFLAQREP